MIYLLSNWKTCVFQLITLEPSLLFLITTWYRPPNSPVAMFNYFEILLGMLDSENIDYYHMGDFNCDLSSIVLDHDSKLLMDIVVLYDLSQLINEPTRITDSSSTLLDHEFYCVMYSGVEYVVCCYSECISHTRQAEKSA